MKKRHASRRDFLKHAALLTGATLIPSSIIVALSRKVSALPLVFDYYISTTGSDSNLGTQASPWAITSLQDTSTNNKKIAGKKVGIVAGTYALSSLQSGSQPSNYQYPVLHLPQGTSGSPTVVQAVSGPGTVILDYSTSTSANPLIGQNPDLFGYWTIDGLTMKGNNSTAQSWLVSGRYNAYSYMNAAFGTAFGITVQNCELYNLNITVPSGSNGGAMIMQGCQGTLIKNNYIHDVTKPADEPHCHGYEEYGCLGSQIHFNTFANCPGGGMDLKAGVSGADIGFNYFYNCGTAAPANAVGAIAGADGAEGDPNSPATGNVAHHNIFDSCGGVHAADVNSTSAQNLSYYNNTIYASQAGSGTIADLRETAGNTGQFYNNILVTTASTGGGSYGVLALSAGNFTKVSNNCYSLHSSTAGWGQGTTYDSLSTWQASASSPDANSIATNPVFASTITPGAGSAQFKLGAGSPCLGTGTGGVNMGAWDGAIDQIGFNPMGSSVETDGGLGPSGDASVVQDNDASSSNGGDAAAQTAPNGSTNSSSNSGGGCGCNVPTRAKGTWGWSMALGVFAIALRRRRTLMP